MIEYDSKIPSQDEMIRRTGTDWREVARYALMIALGAVLVGLAIRVGIRAAHGQTPEQWFTLVALLQRQSRVCIAKEDRTFLAAMVNQLTVDDPADPEPWQKKWILALKRECKIR